MSRARHKRHEERAAGGKVVAYTAGDSNVMKEAHERKRGGRVHHGEGEEGKHHAGKRKRGGKVEAMGHGHHHHEHASLHGTHHRKHGGKVEHEKHDEHGHEHEHKKRARGGAVGSDKRPLSSAANVKRLPEEKGGAEGAGPANEQHDH